jgi:hypothetical protein
MLRSRRPSPLLRPSQQPRAALEANRWWNVAAAAVGLAIAGPTAVHGSTPRGSPRARAGRSPRQRRRRGTMFQHLSSLQKSCSFFCSILSRSTGQRKHTHELNLISLDASADGYCIDAP